jgi:hypothetical protein
MNCSDYQKMSVSEVFSELSPTLHVDYLQHLSQCSSCAQHHAFIKAQLKSIQFEKISEPTPYFFEALKARIENTKAQPWINTIPMYARIAAFSIIIGVAGYGGSTLGNYGASVYNFSKYQTAINQAENESVAGLELNDVSFDILNEN